jgi:hypothetical protein
MIYADADGFSDGTDISNAFSGMTLSAVGRASGLDGKVYAKTDAYASTGTMTFGNNLANPTLWYFDTHPTTPPHPDDYALRIDFDMPAKYLAIDMIGQGQSWGVIEAYNSSNNFISADFIQPSGHDWTDGEIVHAEINPHQSYDIAYVLVGGRYYDAGHFATPLHLDNLSAEIIPEPATILLLGLGGLALLTKRRFR